MATIAPAGVSLALYEGLGALPWFNPDLDGEGDSPPAEVGDLRACIGEADGVLICTPEYAHGVPGVLKNALDWLVSSAEFPGKPIALIDISPRSTYVQESLSETLRTMSATLVTDAAFAVSVPRGISSVAEITADTNVVAALSAALHAFSRAIGAPS